MRPFSCVPALIVLLLTAGLGRAQQPVTPDTRSLDFKEFGLLAIQDNGRRKPIDTFARQTLIQLTGRSSYTDKAGRRWTPNDFLLSAVLETRDWKEEPMVLVSFGELKEQLGLEKTQRRFSFAQLSEAATLPQNRERGARAQAGRETARSVAAGSLECQRSAGAFRAGDGRERAIDRALATKRNGSMGAASPFGHRFLL